MSASIARHPSDQTLRAHGLGRLEGAAAEAVKAHLEACNECRRRAGEFSTDRFFDGLSGAQESASPPPLREDSAASVLDLPPPELLDHSDYQYVREIGPGGMGVVYLVHNKLMNRPEVLETEGDIAIA
jgi:hypothetical protein